MTFCASVSKLKQCFCFEQTMDWWPELVELFYWVSEREIWSVLEDLAEARYKKCTGVRKDKVGQ